MTDDRAYDWYVTANSAICVAGACYIYAGKLPDLDGEAVWFIRRGERVIASGIAADLGTAQANAEQTLKDWTGLEMPVFQGI